MKRKFLSLLALLLTLSLLSGCAFPGRSLSADDWNQRMEELASQESTATLTEAAQLPELYPDYVPYEEYERPAAAMEEAWPFSQITYERPDVDAAIESIGRVQTLVESGESVNEVISAFDEVYADYAWVETMSQLAYIRYTLDLNDEFYTEENTWCEEQGPLLEQALEKCYIAMSNSPLRQALEGLYFGEGFFDYYDEHQVYSNDRVVTLMQEESQLQNDYMSLQSDMTVLWEGEEQLVKDLLADETLDYSSMLEIYALYYEKYNPQAAELFVRLIQVRREIAEELGYESYAHFAYEFYYYRDYTPEQVVDYTSDIARELSPLYYAAVLYSSSEEMDVETVQEKLADTAYRFGGVFATAYEFMEAYELSDFTQSTSKMPGSYMTYLPSYQMPFLYVSPTGTADDLLTAVHEFGHFVDGFANCNATTSIDCAEIFSQGLEYLALNRADLTRHQRTALTEGKVSDAILVFLTQACYAEFEQRAYDLPENALNAEGLNELFLECNEEFGMRMTGMDDILAPGWIDIQHFFIAPFYVISYCISNDAALQIYQTELETGDGLQVYYDLLGLSANNTVLALLEEADMSLPFAPGRIAELANFFHERLG